jgi:hypothetical protein
MESLIVSHILGGLGNQMFQYAAGRALSLARASPLRLDISDFTEYRLHQGFELTRMFSCPVTLAEPKEVRAIQGWLSSRRLRRVVARPGLRFLRNRHFVVEPQFQYWSGIHDVPLPCYLMGYWQSERYFTNVAQTIRADFTFRQPLTGRNLEIAQQIDMVNSVSLHIRRGDYASNPKTLSIHGVCPLTYYDVAVRYIAERIESPHFFVFSDDIDWAQKNLRLDFSYEFITHNHGAESYRDMQLISLCDHHIIANSSFSWWGAWLNAKPDKIVVAPKKWFAHDADVSDLFPADWMTL